MFTNQPQVLCTAGCNYMLLYPNGDVYRCMADYNVHAKPLFNALHHKWHPYIKSESCLHTRCYAGCDIDWTGKYLTSASAGERVFQPRICAFDPELGILWARQNLKAPGNNFVSIVWAPSLLCNYDCYYCGCAGTKDKIFSQFLSSSPMLSLQEWLTVWDSILARYDYCTVQITGGEPLLSPALLPVLRRIATRFSVCLTSNLSVHLDDLIASDIEPGGICKTPVGSMPCGLWRITASMHPTATPFDRSHFLNAVHVLRQRGYKIDIHFVAHPRQLYQADEILRWTDAHDVGFVLSPWTGTDQNGKTATYTAEEQHYINRFIQSRKTRALDEVFCSIAHVISIDIAHEAALNSSVHEVAGKVLNTSDCAWEIDGHVKLGARLFAGTGGPALREFRAPLANGLLPSGETRQFCMPLDLTGIPDGTYRLSIDVVNEGKFWLEDKGASPLIVDIRIRHA